MRCTPAGTENHKPPLSPSQATSPSNLCASFTDLQVMTRGVEVAGKVVDAAKAVVGAEVGWMAAADQNTFHESLIKTITNAEGRFQDSACPSRPI